MPTTTVAYGGFDTVPLNLISEGNYSSEFMARNPTSELRLKIRHSQEKATAGAVALDRHNVEFTVRTFPTSDLPAGRVESAYMVIRSDPNSNGSSAMDIIDTLTSYVEAHKADIVAWATPS